MAIDIAKLEEGKEIFKKISQSREIIDKFKLSIDKQISENKEYGIDICSKNDTLVTTSWRIGCPEGSRLIADFHTHPKRPRPTEEDMGKSIDRKLGISCIGAYEETTGRKIVTCYYPYFHKRRIFAEYIGNIG